MRHKAFREQKRLLRRILARMEQPIDWTNYGDLYKDIGFCDRLVIDGRKLTAQTRKTYLVAVLEFMVKNLAEAPEGARLVFILREDNLLSSRAIIFFDQDYQEQFWKRESWTVQDESVLDFSSCPLPPTLPARLLMERRGKTLTRLLVLG